MIRKSGAFVALLLSMAAMARCETAPAEPSRPESPPAGAPADKWYIQWGYNTDHYAPVDIRFDQPELNNDFTLSGDMHDAPSWDFWNHPVSVPQYSIRIGRFVGKNTAIELNFDHSKALLEATSQAHLSGTLDGVPVNQDVLVGDYVQKYKLNNGANFFLVNLVQRFPLAGVTDHAGSLALVGKAGVGFMIPHTENTVLGQDNEPGFQYGGPGAGLEAAFRWQFIKHSFLEVSQKGFYGHYRDLHINQGSASQDLWAYMTILSLGFSL